MCQKNAFSDAQNFLKMQNLHFPNIFYGKKRPRFCCTSFIWLVVICYLYVNLCIYKKMVGVGFFVLAFGSPSDRSSGKFSAVF